MAASDHGLLPLPIEECESLGDLGVGVSYHFWLASCVHDLLRRFDVAFQTAKILVADPLETFEAGNETMRFLAGQEPALACGQVYMMNPIPAGREGFLLAGLFKGHVVEVAHHADARIIQFLAEGCRLFQAIDVERVLFSQAAPATCGCPPSRRNRPASGKRSSGHHLVQFCGGQLDSPLKHGTQTTPVDPSAAAASKTLLKSARAFLRFARSSET